MIYNDLERFARPRQATFWKDAIMEQPEPSTRGSFLSVLLTLIFGGGFLMFLILVTGGFFFYVALAVLAVGSVGFLHYVLWGQALTQEVAVERAIEEEKMRAEADGYPRDQHGIRRG
jgi:hypothetical protein